ncbi:MAG: lysophospholipid acyltransferase family protein, partial [Candidatus Aminicenantes bacterium]|nr:lysophospholipid acyltransferase family protein [Candidatus Aminicenantes bacterium]
GFLFKYLSPRHGKIVTRNLKIAFPEKKDQDIEQLKEKIYHHFSTIFTQVIYLYVKKKPEKILPEITIHNQEILENILKRGKGVILFSAHFGNWELVPFIISRQLNRKTHNIARKMDNPLIEEKVKAFRDFMGSRIIYKKGSIKTILKELNNNQIIGMIIDQNTLPEEGVSVDFFSRKVCAIPSVSLLHLKRQVPILPVFIHYEPDKIVFEIMDEIDFQPSGHFEQDLIKLTQYCNRIIENKIREFPEQWFWFHQRWKNQPEGEIHERG